MKQTLILILALCAGCGPPLTHREQLLLGGMITAQAADGWTTDRYIGIGGTELHPAVGDRPDTESIALLKVGTVLVLYGMGEIWPEHRDAFYTTGIVTGGVNAGRNAYLYEKHK